MTKIFISYAREDSDFVEKIATDIETSDLSVVFDKRVMKTGDSLFKLFDEIGTSDFLIPVLSEASIDSEWVKKEMRVAIIKQIEENDFTVLPIISNNDNWDVLKNKMPVGLREALRDIYVGRFDIQPYKEALLELVANLSCGEDSRQVYAKIEGANSDNPFRRVRTEYYEDLKMLAKIFTKPDSTRYLKIVEVKPAFVEGGRGSGKTMVLRSLEAIVSIYQSGSRNFKDSRLSYFGVYCRLTRGAFATQGTNILEHVTIDVASRLFNSELILRLAQSLIQQLSECEKLNMLDINTETERNIVKTIFEQVQSERIDTELLDFSSCERELENRLRSINNYVSRRIFGESLDYQGTFLTKSELQHMCQAILKAIPDFKDITMYFLLDEYENLHDFQKTVINTLIKWAQTGCFTLKVATKKTGLSFPGTLEGQDIEESHDYSRIDLDYDLSNREHRDRYKELLISICEKTLRNEGFKEKDIRILLGNGLEYAGYSQSAIDKKIIEILEINETSFKKGKEEYRHRLEVAAMYRLLQQKQKAKVFSGFDEFVTLSSGIVRYFLELCGMSYYFAVQNTQNIKIGEPIRDTSQNQAAYILSRYYFDTVKRNIANDGPIIQMLILDLGDIFRQKLLNHLSEPEAARVSITDPELLEESTMQPLKHLLKVAEMHSILQAPIGLGGIRPKHATEVQPKEYILNRIYAPVLQFSLRPRWRTKFTCNDLYSLINPDMRKRTKADLLRRIAKPKNPHAYTLFDHTEALKDD